MGTELMRVCIKEDNDEFPPVPPGFESFTSFTLNRVNDTEKQMSKSIFDCSAPGGASELQSVRVETKSNLNDAGKIKRSLRHRPSRSYGQYDYSSEDESGSERLNQVGPCSFCMYALCICHLRSPSCEHYASRFFSYVHCCCRTFK